MRKALLTLTLAVLATLATAPAYADIKPGCKQSAGLNSRTVDSALNIGSGEWNEVSRFKAFIHSGNSYYQIKQYCQAIRAYDEALRLNPKSAMAYNNRGNAYDALKQYWQAIQDYDDALELNPKDSEVLYNRGITYYHLKEFRLAIADYNATLRLDPLNESAIHNRGNAYNELAWSQYLQGQDADALVNVERALAQNPRNLAILDTRAHVLAALGRMDDAYALFDQIVSAADADRVKEYQRAFKRHGHYAGPIDGVYSSSVRQALHACLNDGCRLLG